MWCLIIPQLIIAQSADTTHSEVIPSSFNKKRLITILATESALYTGSLIGLNQLWYKNYPRSSFHFFDDSKDWLQMDKVGHAITSYYIGKIGINLLDWTGMPHNKSIWYGGMLGFTYQTVIELLDGYSAEWGFSISDIGGNTAGSILLMGQELGWKEQRVVLKYSFHQTPFAKYRPNLLGHNLQENLIKDYNGQTYWLSINIASFFKKKVLFPKWLNVALGYGADGMIGGSKNPAMADANGSPIYFDRYRQFYLSLDIDLTRIKTKSKLVNTLFKTIGFIKIPAPALEFNKYGVKGNWIGF
ncbi:MAG: DUF2279 domain-containing protein [Bacteroidia bacterium]